MTSDLVSSTRGGLFLSPHFDDVALSCAGTLRVLQAGGAATLVVTLFAGPPPDDLPITSLHRRLVGDPAAGAGELHTWWATRAAEDRAAMRVLASELVHLAAPEAALRPGVDDWSQIWGRAPAPPWPFDELLAEVRSLWRARGEPVVFAPLAVGGHVDHDAGFRLGVALRAAGATTLFYEDFPYAVRPGQLERRLGVLGPLTSTLVDTAAHLPAWIEAVGCYRSQLAGMFGGADRVAPVLTAIGAARGGERLWR